jgi:hypothetical protein
VSYYTFEKPGTRVPRVVKVNYQTRTMARIDVIGCMDSDHRVYSDGDSHRWSSAPRGVTLESNTPAVALWVRVQDKNYRKHASSAFAYLCAKHSGVIKRLVTQGASSYSGMRLVKDATFDATADVLAAIAIEEAAFDAAEAAGRAERKQYIKDNRVSRILDADTSLSRENPADRSYGQHRVEQETDEYGATRVAIGGATLSIPDARRVAKAILAAADEAHQKNEEALS